MRIGSSVLTLTCQNAARRHASQVIFAGSDIGLQTKALGIILISMERDIYRSTRNGALFALTDDERNARFACDDDLELLREFTVGKSAVEEDDKEE